MTDIRCNDCHDTGKLKCGACRGEGRKLDDDGDPIWHDLDCDECGGKGTVECVFCPPDEPALAMDNPEDVAIAQSVIDRAAAVMQNASAHIERLRAENEELKEKLEWAGVNYNAVLDLLSESDKREDDLEIALAAKDEALRSIREEADRCAQIQGATRAHPIGYGKIASIADAALSPPIQTSSTPTIGTRDERQKRVASWAAAAFGVEQATSLPQRGLRLLEEAIEAAQAAGSAREQAHKLVDYVYDHPAGKLAQELGGVGVTVLALAHAAGISADGAEVAEVERVLSKPLEHFAARNKAKNDAGFLAVAPSEQPGSIGGGETPEGGA